MIWLTQQTFDRLNAELEERRGPIRAEIVERISAARDEGDLEGERRLPRGQGRAGHERGAASASSRRCSRTPPPSLRRRRKVSPGKIVTYSYAGDDEESFLLGAREIAEDHTDVKVYSPESPLGAALAGTRPARPSTSSSPTARSRRSRSSARRLQRHRAASGHLASSSLGLAAAVPSGCAGRHVLLDSRAGSRARAGGPAPLRRGPPRGSPAAGAPRPRPATGRRRSARARPR